MYNHNRLQWLNKTAMKVAAVLVVASILAMCATGCSDAVLLQELSLQQTCPNAQTYRYAECLPSLVPGGQDCPGEKVSWQIYDSLGVACYRYQVMDRSVSSTGCVTYDLHCLDSPGNLLNIDATSIPVWRHTDPLTGAMNQFDLHGYLPGQSFTLLAVVNDSTGQVLPVWWNLTPEQR